MHSIVHRFIWGGVIVGVGVVFLLNQLGWIAMDLGSLIGTYWPVLLIIFGLQGLLLQHAAGFWWNAVTVLVGCYFLGRNLDLLAWSFSDFIRFLAPIAIILFGVNMIFKGNLPKKPKSKEAPETWNPVHPNVPPEPPGPPPVPPELEEFERRNSPPPSQEPPNPYGTYSEPRNEMPPPPPREGHRGSYSGWESARERKDWSQDWRHSCKNSHSRFIGDTHFGSDYWELKPMSISHFIGDTTLDLTKAQIPVGETKIYVSSFIGDVKVFVPNDLSVGLQVESSCLIGDVKVLDQKRGGLFNQMTVETPSFGDTEKRVILIVSSFIGDVRVTKVG
ncbi:cell wall-active antibiotics response protein LiaF [Paenibacillaceae bacterium WGS1546]|uniref:cell wall-active antibiotics response protein LiaF n=1 Tax=Cohnella sp. WGS1546 TaxID=3366810 RepID=UPI00372CFF1C